MTPDNSLKQRLIVAGILIPLVCGFAYLGNLPFAIFIGLALALAAWEFWRMFCVGGFSPSLAILVLFTTSAVWLRYQFQFQYMDLWLAALVLASMFVAVVQQAKNVPNATFNFALTISGSLYVGWLGSYVISLRSLPQGLAWTLIVIFAAAMGDTGGYIFGRRFGQHKIAPAISPKKSWEGYLGGILVGGVSTWLFAWLCHWLFPAVLPVDGFILGIILSTLTPVGDFAESMIKRQFHLKDSSQILPGHGGILDRIDSSLWAITIGYYLLLLLK